MVLPMQLPSYVVATVPSSSTTTAFSQAPYIKLPSEKSFEMIKVRKILKQHPGNCKVLVYFEDVEKLFAMRAELWVDITEELLEELCEILPSEHVKTR